MEAAILEHILDGREKPTNLPFSLLKKITERFSEDLVIGQGGFATVYKGVLPNAIVAVKRIRNSHTIDEKLFYREVDSLLTINHQNVVRFLGFCANTEQTAIQLEGSRKHIYAEIRERLRCFEYMSGGSLQKHITDELRGLEWNTRYQIIKGICEGLHHLHKEKRIYHMDLKPANILLDNHSMPKITDFGLSRLDEKSQTMTKDRPGSLGYCAPEYLHSGKMSFKSDMFSLGVIITELVTGCKGIPDNSKTNVLRRWRHRWQSSGKETPLIYQQVAKCMEIGLLCQEIDPSKRPFIWDLIHDIREMESINGEISNAGQISPYSEDGMLEVKPIVLHFPFELNKQISCSLQLTNHTDAYIAFNILNMSPLPYCIQPNKDIVQPRSKCSVDITLQAQEKVPQNMRHAEEFFVWSTKVNDGLAADDITTNMFSKESGVVDAVNLDVVFNAEESTKVNDGIAAEDITTNNFNKETCVVDKVNLKARCNQNSGNPSTGSYDQLSYIEHDCYLPNALFGISNEGHVGTNDFLRNGIDAAKYQNHMSTDIDNNYRIPKDVQQVISSSMVSSQSFGVSDMALNSWLPAPPLNRMRTFTKVYKRGSVGRSIDIARYINYDELKYDLAAMFGIEGQLGEQQWIDWKLVYHGHDDDILLLGDDPWEKFVNCVRVIRILSPQEVQQMSLDGDLGTKVLPNEASSSSDDKGNFLKLSL